MKSLMRLGAFLLVASYVSTLLLPAVALAQSGTQQNGGCLDAACSEPISASSTPSHSSTPTCQMSIVPSVVYPGASATISWTSSNATGGAITNVGNVGPSGRQQIIPPLAQSTTYVGSFTGPNGTANCSATVQVSYGVSGNDTGNGTSISPGVQYNNGTLGGSTDSNGVPIAPSNVNPQTLSPASGGSPSALVQCGIGPGYSAVNCEACNLAQLVSNLINFAIGLSIPIAAALFAWAGILYFTSGANPANKENARKIFSSALIGFLITISAWLVINTLLHVLLNQNQFPNGSWFTVQCSAGLGTGAGQRNVSGNINSVINSILPGVNTTQPPIVSSSNFNDTYNSDTSQFTPSCSGAGYQLTHDEAGNVACYNTDTGDYQAPSYSYTNPTPNPGGGVSSVATGDIAAAATAYEGTDTSAGPDGGNKACAWAVNNILQNAGIDPIDGNSVAAMEQQLQNGRGISLDQSTAQAGDLVIFGGMSHVGICQDAGCTVVLSNSSRNASFTSSYAPTPGSRFYRVN